jgi:hypothetical protein
MSRRVPPHAAGDHKRLDTVLAAGLAHTRLTATNPPPAPKARKAPDALGLYNLPDDVLLQILSEPQDCEILLNMCSSNRAFRGICADEDHDFGEAVLRRKGWTAAKKETDGRSLKQFYVMMCKMKEIPDRWMRGNTQLVMKALPSGITHIGNAAFRGCTSLLLDAPEALPPNLESIGIEAFGGCKSLVLQALPSNLDKIRMLTFSGCTSLALQELPPELKSIGNRAFHGCTSLALQALPPTVEQILSVAFGGCTSLALQELPPELTYIGKHAFDGCTSLALGDFTTLLPDLEIGPFAFLGCDHLRNTPFGEAVRLKQPRAFE